MPKQHREDIKSANQTRAAWLLSVRQIAIGWLYFTVILGILVADGNRVWAQNAGVQLLKVAETATHIEYKFSNPQLQILPPFELPVAVLQGSADIQILSQQVRSIPTPIDSIQAKAWALKSTQVPVVETGFVGSFRGQDIASVVLHVARFSPNQANQRNAANTSSWGAASSEITRELHIRVGKTGISPDIDQWDGQQLDRRPQSWPASTTNKVQIGIRLEQKSSTPLASGQWYKIPVSREGIYGLDVDYLDELGLNLDSIDPRNLQLWGTDGKVLPERNNAARPNFAQIPILIQGEADGQFNGSDMLLFYGFSPHKESRNLGEFSHSIHPYSDSTFVFLTVGEQPGLRMKSETDFCAPCANQVQFEDFNWMEQELNKSETRQKTGRYFLGQRIPSTAQGQNVSIYKDTLVQVNADEPLLLSGRIYVRSENRPILQLKANGEVLNTFSVNSLTSGYNSYEFESARAYSFSQIPFSLNSSDFINSGDAVIELSVTMSNGDAGTEAFVDYVRVTSTRAQYADNGKISMYAPNDADGQTVRSFTVSGFIAEPKVLEVSNPVEPVTVPITNSFGTGITATHTFQHGSDFSDRYWIQTGYFKPFIGRKVTNQNLRGISRYPNYIIITSPTFLPYAEELAQYRSDQGLDALVVTQEQIFNEFSGGVTDPSAIRDFLKYLWDRALAQGQQLPEHLLLFGDATFDTKNIKSGFTNYVITFQSSESIHRTNSYGTDDYFAYMDDGEGIFGSSDRVDLGVGRISAQTRSEARIALDKIYRYEDPTNAGEWQNLFTFAGDDDFPEPARNRDLHVLNADGTAIRMNLDEPGARLKKIYLFAYPEEITAAGRQFPAATQDLIDTFNRGMLVFNYSGHGNAQTLTDEELFLSDYIPQLNNQNKLALVVTATCQFGRYDDIDTQSGAEKLVLAENGGAIASFTTTRVVYTSSSTSALNFGLNIALSQKMLERDAEGRPLRLGDIFLRTKNTSIGSELNARKFILLGDPALRLALPDRKGSFTHINQVKLDTLSYPLSLRALDRVELEGEIKLPNGQRHSSFNGEAVLTLFDAKRRVSIPQDREWVSSYGCYLNRGTELECTYEVESDVLFRGKAEVKNGRFSTRFILPKDMSFSPETSRMLIFAKSTDETAGGSYTQLRFSGVNPDAINDGEGPQMDLYLNDPSFFNGSLMNSSPTVFVELRDSSGINTTGTGIGHEIIATLDTQPPREFVLNDFYEGELNDFTKGQIEYPLKDIPEGAYTLKVRAWDVHNNPSEQSISFEVESEENLIVRDVYNYPNPMSNFTQFVFEHNQPGIPLDVSIRIYTLTGAPIQLIQETIIGNSSYASIPWDGLDRDFDRLGNGTYVYVLRVSTETPEGRKTIEQIEKLVVIR